MPIQVVACVIEQKDKVLVCQRPPHKRHGGLWEFPGGKVEPGESASDAVRREIAEELGVQVVHAGPPEFRKQDPGSDYVITFFPVQIQGDVRCLEHAELRWLPEEALFSVPLAPSDRSYVLQRRGLAPEAALRDWLRGWATIWDSEGLEDRVKVRFSGRLKRALGRCRPASGHVALQEALLDGPLETLMEVFCHEVAHIVVWDRLGPTARPHGPEWKSVVQAAGFEPEVRKPAGRHIHSAGSEGYVGKPTVSRVTALALLPYEHRCPVCQAVRYARRPVSVWRCSACIELGLSGKMVIKKRATPPPSFAPDPPVDPEANGDP